MDNYICMICKKSGNINEVPYKIIDSSNDMTRFKGQICENCYKELIANKEKKNVQN